MADTPLTGPPIDPREQPILDKLISIRTQLFLLKQDRATYVKSSDVMPLYTKVIEQVQILNDVRSEHPLEENRVDHALEGCFQLLSLFFMTIGRNNEAPAAYALTSTIKRLLDHLTESELYSGKDLEHVAHTLIRLSDIVKKAHDKYSPKLVTLLSNRLEVCHELCSNLQQQLEHLDPAVASIHERLISILRNISLANTKAKFSPTEVKQLREQLKEIDAEQLDGHFVNQSGDTPTGNDAVSGLLKRCLLWADIVLEKNGQIPEAYKKTYDTLVKIRNELEKLSLTQAWSLRETDLYDFQRQLDKIDESRIGGNFLDSQGNPADLYVQRTLLYLIRRSYGYIYYLMVSSEPVSEALLPVYNQLQTLRRCLIEVKNSGGVSSPRELYPYSMKLHSIEHMRVDGKFMVGDDIPEGQGSVNDLLAECFELNYELRVAAETEETEEDEEEEDDTKEEEVANEDVKEDANVEFTKAASHEEVKTEEPLREGSKTDDNTIEMPTLENFRKENDLKEVGAHEVTKEQEVNESAPHHEVKKGQAANEVTPHEVVKEKEPVNEVTPHEFKAHDATDTNTKAEEQVNDATPHDIKKNEFTKVDIKAEESANEVTKHEFKKIDATNANIKSDEPVNEVTPHELKKNEATKVDAGPEETAT